jgi:hypothetical protein
VLPHRKMSNAVQHTATLRYIVLFSCLVVITQPHVRFLEGFGIVLELVHEQVCYMVKTLWAWTLNECCSSVCNLIVSKLA